MSRALGTDLAVLAAVCSVVSWLAFGILTTTKPAPQGTGDAPGAFMDLATVALSVAAGAMSAVRARLSGEKIPYLASLGLVLYGLVLVGTTDLVLPTGRHWTHSLGLVGDFSWVVILVLILSNATPGSRTRSWRLRAMLIVPGCILALSTTVAVVDRAALLGERPLWSVQWVLANSVAAGMWIVLGALAIRHGYSRGDALLLWSGVAMCVFGEGRIAYLLAAENDLWRVAGQLFRAVGMMTVLLGSGRAAYQAITDHRVQLEESIRAVEGSELSRVSERRRQEEMIHDLLSALASVGSAARLLAVGEVPIEGDQREVLLSAIDTELRRVRELVRPDESNLESFLLNDALLPVIVCSRAEGTRILMDIPRAMCAHGDAAGTAEIIRTLIDNGRRHAPGSEIEISARRVEERILLVVEDRGPGVPPGTEETVFERGWTTDRSGDGSGLGLFVAARLARRQGASLTAHRRVGGGASFWLELAAADMPADVFCLTDCAPEPA